MKMKMKMKMKKRRRRRGGGGKVDWVVLIFLLIVVRRPSQ